MPQVPSSSICTPRPHRVRLLDEEVHAVNCVAVNSSTSSAARAAGAVEDAAAEQPRVQAGERRWPWRAGSRPGPRRRATAALLTTARSRAPAGLSTARARTDPGSPSIRAGQSGASNSSSAHRARVGVGRGRNPGRAPTARRSPRPRTAPATARRPGAPARRADARRSARARRPPCPARHSGLAAARSAQSRSQSAHASAGRGTGKVGSPAVCVSTWRTGWPAVLEFRPVPRHRVVEADQAALDQHQHRQRDHRLAHRIDVDQGVRVPRPGPRGVAPALAQVDHRLAVAQHAAAPDPPLATAPANASRDRLVTGRHPSITASSAARYRRGAKLGAWAQRSRSTWWSSVSASAARRSPGGWPQAGLTRGRRRDTPWSAASAPTGAASRPR